MKNANNLKSWVQEVFDRAAPMYGKNGCTYFEEFGSQLVSLARISPGEKILDVATGNGAVLFEAAQAVGKTGSAVGIDLSPSMIAEAKKRPGASSTWLLVMDAEELDFPEHSFDVVFCGFSLMFFPNLQTALEGFRRVLKPGGRIAVSTWGKLSPLTQWVVEKAERFGACKQLKSHSLDSGEILQKTLNAAGFCDLQIEEKKKVFWHESPEAWWEALWSHAVRSRLEQLSSENLASVQKEALIQVAKTSTEKRIGDPMHAIFAIGKKK